MAKRRIFASLSNIEIFRDISLTHVTSSFRNYKEYLKKKPTSKVISRNVDPTFSQNLLVGYNGSEIV